MIPAWAGPPTALVLVLALTPLVRNYALRRGLVDRPGPRRSHDRPVARGAGLAVAVAVMAAIPVTGSAMALPFTACIGLLAVLGAVDDHRAVSVGARLAVQIAVAVLAVIWIGPVETVSIGGWPITAPLLWSALAVLAMAWLINLHNFMDGSDGLASLQGAICGGLFAWAFARSGATGLAWPALVLAAACAGFLFWNRPPARVFLGDSGSLAIGGFIGLLALAGAASGVVSVWLSLAICMVFVIDATATLADRLIRGRRWYTPHRDHAYQRLIRAGWSHARVLRTYGLINLGVVLPGVALILHTPDHDLLVAAVLAGLMLAGWGVVRLFAVAEHQEQ